MKVSVEAVEGPVHTSKDNGHRAEPIPPAHLRHREVHVKFVRAEGGPLHRELSDFWREANERFFGGEMYEPYILLNEPSNPRRWGDCSPRSGFGGRSQIRLRPSLLGTRGVEFVKDVLLHEMIHQWQQEVTGEREDQYFGHGPTFRDKTNEIGAKLGLGPVRCKKRGKDKDLPSCAHWPHCVRGYAAPGRIEKPLEEQAERTVRRLGPVRAVEYAQLIISCARDQKRQQPEKEGPTDER